MEQRWWSSLGLGRQIDTVGIVELMAVGIEECIVVGIVGSVGRKIDTVGRLEQIVVGIVGHIVADIVAGQLEQTVGRYSGTAGTVELLVADIVERIVVGIVEQLVGRWSDIVGCIAGRIVGLELVAEHIAVGRIAGTVARIEPRFPS